MTEILIEEIVEFTNDKIKSSQTTKIEAARKEFAIEKEKHRLKFISAVGHSDEFKDAWQMSVLRKLLCVRSYLG